MRGGERLQASGEAHLEIVDVAAGELRLARHRLNHGKQIFRPVRDFAHQKLDVLLPPLALGDVARGAGHAHRDAVGEVRPPVCRHPALDAVAHAVDALLDVVLDGHRRILGALDGGERRFAVERVERRDEDIE